MHTTLTPVVAGHIWECSHEIRMLPGVYLPARMLVIRLEEDALALWSPVPFDDAIAGAIGELGRVTTIIAPNNYHHLYLRPAMERYPEASTWAAPGLPAKRKTLHLPNLLGVDAAPPFAHVLKPFFLEGSPAMQETVFQHLPTRTLIVTDALFNLHRTRGLLSPLLYRLTGSLGKPAQSRIWRSTVQDRAAMGRSIAALLNEDFDRVIMAHGDIIPTGGKHIFGAAAAWLPGVGDGTLGSEGSR